MVSYPAAECCKDYPSTMCEKDVQPMNPCLNQEDFLPDAYAYTSCDLSEVNPTKRQCEATPDCKEQWGWCECKTKSACELLGGNFYGGTCQEELKWWSPGDHKGVKEALEKHTCQGVKGSYEGDIKYRVDWLGHSCCLSKKSICEELDNYSSHYSGMYWGHRASTGNIGQLFCLMFTCFWPEVPAQVPVWSIFSAPTSVPFEKSCCEASCFVKFGMASSQSV